MSSPVGDPEDHDGHLRYAPKLVRDSNFQKSPSIAEGEFPHDSEPSNPIERLIADLEGSPHPLHTVIANAARQHSSTSPPRVEDKNSENGERSPSAQDDRARLRRVLHPEFYNEPRQSPPRQWWRLTFVGVAFAAATIGAAILLFITDKFPGEWNRAVQDRTGFMSRFSGDTPKYSGDPSSIPRVPTVLTGVLPPGNLPIAATAPKPSNAAPPTAGLPIASAAPEPNGAAPARVATVEGPSESGRTIHGVSDSEIRFGISAPFTGAAKELGNQMRLGIQTAFYVANDAGGINGRQAKLAVADDGYEPTRTADMMKQLFRETAGLWRRRQCWNSYSGSCPAIRSRAPRTIFRGVYRRRPTAS
jgi:hypothetical protein